MLRLMCPVALSFALSAVPLEAKAKPATADPEIIRAAGAEWAAKDEARRACAANAGDLAEQMVAGTVDAEHEARRAADRGCFGMITTVSAIPTGLYYAPGVECRLDHRRLARLQLLSYSVGSDLLFVGRAGGEELRKDAMDWRAFALAYNAAVVAHPAFPYRDLCRPAAPDYRPSGLVEQLEPAEWGFRPLNETDQPRDLYEAARRGTLASLRALIEARPIDLHVPDVLGLTPLAWAVIYGRLDHMHLMLAAGAHPYGQPGLTQPGPTSPFTIARTERSRELAAVMRPALAARGLTPPDVPAKLDTTRSTPVYTGAMTFELTISASGRVTDCHLLLGETRFEYPVTCERIQKSVVYIPAENRNGDAVATAVRYRSLLPAPSRNRTLP